MSEASVLFFPMMNRSFVLSSCLENCSVRTLTAIRHTDEHLGIPRSAVILLVYLIDGIILPVICPAILFAVSTILWNIYVSCSRDPSCSLPLPPGSSGLPVIGETLQFIMKGRKFFDEKRRKHGNIYRTHMLGKPTIRIVGIKGVKQIMAGENFRVTTEWPRSTRMLLGEGSLSSSTGLTHSIRKKAILRAFTHEAISSYTPVVLEVVRDYISSWCDRASILGYKEFRSMNFELTCRVLLGIDMDRPEKTRLMGHFETFLGSLFSLPVCVPGLGLYKGMKARDALLQKIEQCIKEKQGSGSPHSFMDALSLMMDIEGEEKLTLDEAKDVGLELLFAGHETTSSAACTLVLQLTKHPKVMLKIVDELARYGLTDSLDVDIPYETVNKLKYTRDVVKEVLRLTPPIGGGYRKALRTFEIEGYQVPKDWAVVYSIRDSHESSEFIDSPEKFDPDRWSNLDVEERQHFLAFGGGKRGCAGKEFALLVLKMLAIELSRSCSWTVPNTDPPMKCLPIPYPTDNLPMQFSGLYQMRQRSLTV
ncbi:cytochrome P450 26A1-like [Mizuhopecten yessoensis]|uniref:Cytochrome P450 26A1 n=1 Tax=Mizuhopecten yessoensis TaxID=6573 RepID=A0A210PP58_MIZYE|nr:cytochrome P450 26A1-like [Mizuhopecten yessoensis]OWF38262.1 Cytochrome P450 26A1 [Mizuhopecten yessoensis]